MMESEPVCAIWYWVHYSLQVTMFDTVQEAAEFAVSLEDDGAGSVRGVQLPSGEFIERENWGDYRIEWDRRDAEADEWARQQREQPKPIVYEIAPPFDARGQHGRTTEKPPAWLQSRVVAG